METERVTFATTVSGRFSLRYESEQIRQLDGGRITAIPQTNIEFVEGIFITDDPKKIEHVRECGAFKRKEIFEVSAEDKAAVLGPKREVVRGTVASADIHKEAGINEADAPVSMAERGFKCDFPDCDREFKGAAALATHKLYHRRKEESKKELIAVKEAEKVTLAEV